MRDEGRGLYATGLLVLGQARLLQRPRHRVPQRHHRRPRSAPRAQALGLRPGFAMVDTCAAEFAAETPYFYATYAAAGSEPEAAAGGRGPRRWSSAPGRSASGRASSSTTARCRPPQTLRDDGGSAVMINSNPETVSTDFDASSRLYFEPLDDESVLEVIDAETRGGRGAPAGAHPVRRPDAAQPGRRRWSEPACRCRASTSRPSTGPRSAHASRAARVASASRSRVAASPTSLEEALAVAERIGYPVMVRPSFVIGGLAIDFCYGPDDLARQLAVATVVDRRPARAHRRLPRGPRGRRRRRHRRHRRAHPGTHGARRARRRPLGRQHRPSSRRSSSRAADQGLIVDAMRRICLEIGVRGLVNAQFIVRDDGVYILEVNPRASRTVPFLSKVTGVPMVALATRVGRRRHACASWAGPTGCCRSRRSWPSRRRCSRRPSCAASIPRWARACSRPARSSASTRTPRGPGQGAAGGGAATRRCRVRRARRRSSRWRRETTTRVGELAGALAAAGYRFVATPGTAAALRAHGHEVREVAMVGEVDE